MKKQILQILKRIEEDYGVKILYACESGSRAWGFPSKDSDYDVRFIYVHKTEDYLTIDPIGVGKKRDVIELPVTDTLDVSGWELTKALRLFRRSNPPLLEWLNSEIVYYKAFSTIEQMRKLGKQIFSPKSCFYHYLNMAGNNFRKYFKNEKVQIKNYFVVLRPLLAAGWIKEFDEFPPLEFYELLEVLVPKGELKNEIMLLLHRKMAGGDADPEPKIWIIHDFLEEELERLRKYAITLNSHHPDYTPELDKLFRETLREVWNS